MRQRGRGSGYEFPELLLARSPYQASTPVAELSPCQAQDAPLDLGLTSAVQLHLRPLPTCILQAGHRDLYLQFLISACNSMPVPGPTRFPLLGMLFALFLDISSFLSAHEGSGTQSTDGRHQRHPLVPMTHLPPLLLSKHPCSSLRALRWSRGKGASLGDSCGQAGLVST